MPDFQSYQTAQPRPRGPAVASAALLLAVALAALAPPPARAEVGSDLLSNADRLLYRRAFALARKADWRSAHRKARKAAEPLPGKVLYWLQYRQPGTRAKFDEIAGFIRANPHWPQIERLTRRAEEAMPRGPEHDQAVLDWFNSRPPLSGAGQLRLAEAMMRRQMTADGITWLRHAWINNTFSKREARSIYRRHKKHLRPEDHVARLDRLLWNGWRYSARRLYGLVPTPQRRLAEARVSLMVQGPGVDAKIAAVPAAFRQDPGLAYERLRWRRRKRLDDRAREILLQAPDVLGPKPQKWWFERHVQARKALREGEISLAYRLAGQHGQTSGSVSFAEAEWLAGWIALRFLNDGKAALGHFQRLHEAVRFPVSRARAAYWLGRAHDDLGDGKTARQWWRRAAAHATTYYGQLAVERLGEAEAWRPPDEPKLDGDAVDAFNRTELVRTVRLLAELGEHEHLRPLLLRLAKAAKTPAQRLLTARLGATVERNELAVRGAKIALRAGTALARAGYPALRGLPAIPIEPALAHAVARQESEFNAKAVSHAGARGLMQLLPRTARKTAKSLRLQYRRQKLFEPRYNIRLGAAYLDRLIRAYKGSYIMALAAYNAGPHRVKRWVRDFGDPRNPAVDAIDWVESIGLSETRNYVQRVLENLQIYRRRLATRPVALALLRDLRRNGVDAN